MKIEPSVYHSVKTSIKFLNIQASYCFKLPVCTVLTNVTTVTNVIFLGSTTWQFYNSIRWSKCSICAADTWCQINLACIKIQELAVRW